MSSIDNKPSLHAKQLFIQALIGRSGLYNLLGQNNKALGDVERALAHAPQDTHQRVDVLIQQSNIYGSLSDYRNMLDGARRAFRLSRKIQSTIGKAESLNNMGYAFTIFGEYSKAIRCHKKSLHLRKKIRDKRGEADSLNNLGYIQDTLGDYRIAIRLYKHSLEIRDAISDDHDKAYTLTNLGYVYSMLDQYQRALDFYRNSFQILEKMGDQEGMAANLNNIGYVYSRMCEYGKALISYNESLRIRKQIGDQKGEANSLTNSAALYSILGDFDRALRCAKEAVNVGKGIRGRIEEALALCAAGAVCAERGQIKKARDYFKTARCLALQLKSRNVTMTVNGKVAAIELDQGNNRVAEKYLREFSEDAHRLNSTGNIAQAFYLFGRLHGAQGELKKSLACFDKAVKLYEKLGNLYELGKVYYWLFIASGRKKRWYIKKSQVLFKKIGAREWLKKTNILCVS